MTDSSNTNDAYDVIADMAAQGDVENAMSLPAGDAMLIDEVSEKIGAKTVELTGYPNQFRPGGVGDTAEALDRGTRLANMHPKAIGSGLVLPIANSGSIDAQGSRAIVGGYARTEHHAPGLSFSVRDSTKEFTFPAGDYRRVDGVELNVKVEEGRRVMLLGTAYVDGRPISSSAYIDIVICIGDENVRIVRNGPTVDFYENETGSDSLSLPIGGDATGARQQGTHIHGRLITGTAATEANGVPCFIKVKQTGTGGTGGSGTTAKFKPGDSAQTTSNANLRSSPNLGDNIVDVIAQGTTGTIVSGPTFADGNSWWRINIGGYTNQYMSDANLRNTTPQGTPAPTTNSIRGASLLIQRLPLG